MPSRVIALVYAHSGDGVYHTAADNETKALLRKVNKAITEQHGHRVGTCWGDARGKDASGSSVFGYALCMDVPADKVSWLLEEFWGASVNAYQEQIAGVGYIAKASGRAPMYALDVSLGASGVQDFLADNFGIQWTPPRPTPKPEPDVKKARKSVKVEEDDPFLAMSLDELRALCDNAEVSYNDDDGKEMLRNLYIQAISQ
jgi:hypothetical protein